MEHESMYFNGTKEISIESLFKEVYNSFTIEFWVKPSDSIHIVNESESGVSGIFGQRFVVGPAIGENKDEAGVGISVGVNGIIVFEHSSSYLPALLVYPVSITEWTHITVIYHEKTPSLYINGEFKKKGLKSLKNKIYASGFFGGYDPYGYYVGFIREIKLWNHERTENKIKESLITKSTGNERGLVGYWTFDGGIIKANIDRYHNIIQEEQKKEQKIVFVKMVQGLPYPPLQDAIVSALNKTVKEPIIVSLHDDIINIAHNTKPNIILYLSNGFGLPFEHVIAVRQLGIKTGVWFTDDPYHIDGSITLVPFFDLIFTTELSGVDIYKSLGCMHVFYLPLAANIDVFQPRLVDKKYQSDILFIGNAFRDRLKLFDSIANYLSEKDVKIVGSWWEKLKNLQLLSGKILHTWLSPDETVNYYNGANIVINVHRSIDDIHYNFNSKRIPAFSVNPRMFEISACGAFQLTDIRHDLANHYTLDYDVGTYTSDKDLILKLDHYLSNDGERISIANRGFQRTLGEHTYINRINKLLDKSLFE